MLSAEQLLDEEGVSFRALVDPLDERWHRLRPQDRGHQLVGLHRVERGEVDPLEPVGSFQPGQPGDDRVTPRELVRPVAQHHRRRLGPQCAGEEGDRMACRGVRPVQILGDDQDRRPLRQPFDEAQERVEQARLQGLGGFAPAEVVSASEDGGDPRQIRPRGADGGGHDVGGSVPDEPAKALGDRRVRHSAIARGPTAASDRDRAAAGRQGCELIDEPRLADARLPDDEEVGRTTADGSLDRRHRRGELPLAADEDRADQPFRHRLDHTRLLAGTTWCVVAGSRFPRTVNPAAADALPLRYGSTPSPLRLDGGAKAHQPAARPSRIGITGTRARFGGAMSQCQTRVACCLSVEIGAVIVCEQANRVPMVHGLLRSRLPPGGGQSERAVGARSGASREVVIVDGRGSLFLERWSFHRLRPDSGSPARRARGAPRRPRPSRSRSVAPGSTARARRTPRWRRGGEG